MADAAMIEYDAWVRQLFERPVPFNFLAADEELWALEEDPVLALRYVKALWSNSGDLSARYSAGQIGQAIWWIVGGGQGEFGIVLQQRTLPLSERIACIQAIETLYRDCFARVCEPALGYLNQGSANRANAAAYVFWDTFQMCACSRAEWAQPDLDDEARADRAALEDACLAVMERKLAIPHVACQEGALHGLGHWVWGYPERVQPAIDTYLERKDITAELRTYAQWARTGSIN